MKIFTQKRIIQKIMIAIAFVILFNFIMPNFSFATEDKDEGKPEIGGKLFEPVKDLILGIADALIWGMQYIVYGMEETFIDLSIRLPIFVLTPEEIFKNKVPLLDVNFFTPLEDAKIYNNYYIKGYGKIEEQDVPSINYIQEGCLGAVYKYLDENGYAGRTDVYLNYIHTGTSDEITTTDQNNQNVTVFFKYWNVEYSWCDQDGIFYQGEFDLSECWEFSTIHDCSIKSGKITKYNGFTNTPDESSATNVISSAKKLQPIISKWYYALRNFAIVALLSILVYIAIRIIISSSMEDRAKYKTRLLDWLIAMCLLFFMHYIMAFSVTLTNEITKSLDTENSITIQAGDEQWNTDLMGKVRIELQLEPSAWSGNQNTMKVFSYTIIYLGLVMYTVLFLFRYLKRLIILAFLTMIAPLVAMTYPLDKIHDNSAQGFDTWIKEYIFNLLIQPVHLILYTVLIGTAIDFASRNIIYSLVAFGFILQAEKIMRRLFGFNKAETASATSAALGGAIAMKGINTLTSHFKGNNQNKGEEQNKIAQANRKPDKDINQLTQSVFGSRNNGGQGSNSSNSGGNQGNGQDNSQNGQGDNQNGQGAGANNNGQPNSPGNSNVNQNFANALTAMSRQAQIIVEEQNRTRKKLEDSKIRNLANKVGNSKFVKGTKYIGPKIAKTGLKGALKAGLMATGATIGLTAGLVSDDFSNVAKYGLAGAGAGLIAGKGITNKIANLKDGISKEYDNFYEATHTKEEMNERDDKKALKDKDRIKKYQEKFGVDKAGAQRIMQEVAQEYRAYGVTDDDIIIKVMKNESLNDNEKLMVAKMASQVNGDEAKYDALKEGLNDRGINSQEAEKYLQIIRDLNNWV